MKSKANTPSLLSTQVPVNQACGTTVSVNLPIKQQDESMLVYNITHSQKVSSFPINSTPAIRLHVPQTGISEHLTLQIQTYIADLLFTNSLLLKESDIINLYIHSISYAFADKYF